MLKEYAMVYGLLSICKPVCRVNVPAGWGVIKQQQHASRRYRRRHKYRKWMNPLKYRSGFWMNYYWKGF